MVARDISRMAFINLSRDVAEAVPYVLALAVLPVSSFYLVCGRRGPPRETVRKQVLHRFLLLY